MLNEGDAILPYAKQFLTPVKPFFGSNKNMGDRIDYGQRRNDDIGGQVTYNRNHDPSFSITRNICSPYFYYFNFALLKVKIILISTTTTESYRRNPVES